MLRRGENTGEYDWEYITELFQSNPENVPEMAYGAMIRIFNEMIISDQEKFIECAYTEHGTLHELYPYLSYPEMPILRREIRLSPVYITMVDIYGYVLSSNTIITDNEKINDKIYSDYNILASVSAHGKVVYVRGFKEGNESVNITLKEVNDFNEHDYLITYEGDTTSTLHGKMNAVPSETLKIEIYGMRTSDGVVESINEHVGAVAEELRVDLWNELAKEAANNLIPALLDIPPKDCDVITILQDSMPYYYNIYEGIETNGNIDKMQEMLSDTSIYMALDINASFSFCNIKYMIHSFNINQGILQDRIDEYNRWAQTQASYETVNFKPTDIEMAFAQGNLDRLEGLDNYIGWYFNIREPLSDSGNIEIYE